VWKLHPDERVDIFRYTTKEPRSITNPYATDNEAVALHPTQGSKEATASSSNEVSSDVVVHSTKDGTKGGKKRHKQHPHGATTTTDHYDDNCGKVGGSDTGRVVTTAHGDKRQVRLPTYHFRRLPGEACPNHAYPIRHKLKDFNMMKSFMISRSFTRGTELDEDPGGSNTMFFHGGDAVMMVYGGHL
jgi:hypothetical protein